MSLLSKYLFVIGMSIIFSSCVPVKDNIYITKGTDYGYNPPKWTIGCMYDNAKFYAIDSLVYRLGTNYNYEKEEHLEKYIWKNIIFQDLSKRSLDILVVRRLDRIGNSDIYECLTLYVSKEDRDFLAPMKYLNRYKTKKLLNNLIEQ